MKKRLLALITSSAFIATVFVSPLPANAVGETDDLVLTIDTSLPGTDDILELVFVGPTENLEIDWLGDDNFIAYDTTTTEYSNGVYDYGSGDSAERTVTVRGLASDRFTFGDGEPMSGANLITGVTEFPVWIDKYFGSFRDANNLTTAIPAALPEETVDGVTQSVVTSTSRMFENAYNFNGDISLWDTSRVTDMSRMFQDAYNFNGDISAWVTSSVTDMSSMFLDAESFNVDIGSWDTSNVIDMSYMFSQTGDFNGDIGDWDTASVTEMQGMFNDAVSFNQNIDYEESEGFWDTSSVTDMSYMFQGADVFNKDLSNWKTGSVTNMEHMFSSAVNFNQPIGTWNVSKVTDMEEMFEKASAFNQDLDNWDVSSVTTMKEMFENTNAFNQDLDNWDVSSVTDMEEMFQDALVFNGSIGNWSPSSVTNFFEMFNDAHAFNQPINNWDVSSAEDMEEMFFDARSFNQDLNSWDVSSVTTMEDMFEKAEAFNGDISDWDTSAVKRFKDMFEEATSFDVYIGGWNTGSATSTTNMFNNSGFTYCLPADFFMADVVDYTTVGLASDFGDSCVKYVAPAPPEPAAPAPVFRPYYGPISKPLAQTAATAGEEVTVNGFRMNTVQTVTAGDQQLEVVSSTSSALVLVVPENLSGMVNLSLHWINDENSGTYNIFEALSVSQPEVQETVEVQTSTTKKINAGSFKGYVAVYALGYEGQRLSAKIGNDWVIVDPIVNNETASLARIVDFTGTGVDINLRVFIDRELVLTMPLLTK